MYATTAAIGHRTVSADSAIWVLMRRACLRSWLTDCDGMGVPVVVLLLAEPLDSGD
jgi:hypothetical protein